MFTRTPRCLSLVAGLAVTGSLVSCSSQQGAKTAEEPKPVAAAAPVAPAEGAAPAAAAGGGAAAGAAPRAPQAVGRPRDQGNWNGTPAEQAGKPGTYMVLNGKPAAVPDVRLGDRATVARIIDEGKNRNRVMDTITHIATKIGPRLTGSANVETANRWAMEQFKSWGYESSLWQWGEIPVRFDRGPSYAKAGTTRDNGEFRSQREMEFTTLAWGGGTNGAVRGPALKMPETEEQFEKVKDKIKGSWVVIKSNAGGGRRGVGGFAGGMSARQRFFADMRKKAAAGEAQPETKPEVKSEAPAAEPAKEGIAGYWSGSATGGPIPAAGTPFGLEVKMADGKVTGTLNYPDFGFSGPIKDAKWDEGSKTLTYSWESPAGSSNYTIKLDGQNVSGESKLPPDIGGTLALTAKRGEAPKAEAKAESADGPSIEERVFLLGPAGYVSASSDERVRTGGTQDWRKLTADTLPKDCEIQVRQSDYDYLNSRLADGAPIELEVNADNKFTPGPIPVYDTIAEIKGSTWPEEVVIVSAHLDSWNGPGSMGTTDNGTGSSVTLEAARILSAVKAKPKRTIRFILWTGEEQGLLGSVAYVKYLKENDQLKNISAVFVDDGGTNFEGGLHVLDSQVPLMGAATAPVNGVFWSATDQRFLDVNIQPSRRAGGGIAGGSSDHASFQREKVPGFFWDEVGRADYGYGWHTQNDKIDLAIPEYLMQSSTCAAVTAYNLACAPSLLPREALPQKDEKKVDQSASLAK